MDPVGFATCPAGQLTPWFEPLATHFQGWNMEPVGLAVMPLGQEGALLPSAPKAAGIRDKIETNRTKGKNKETTLVFVFILESLARSQILVKAYLPIFIFPATKKT